MSRKRFIHPLLLAVGIVCILLCANPAWSQGNSGRVEVIVGFHERPGAEQVQMLENVGGQVMWAFSIVPAITISIPEAAVPGIERNPRVRYVEPNFELHAHEDQVVPWGITRVFGNEDYPFSTWSTAETKGAGISVGVIDTGVDLDHPDLPRVASGTHFYTAGFRLRQDSNYDDDNGHGTHVAGTIAALDNQIGVVGVAPDVDLYAIKVLNQSGSGSLTAVAAGVEWAMTQGLDVINMSLGGTSDSTTLRDACAAAYGAGVLIVASAGNAGAGTDTVGYPAKYPSVIAVAATDSGDARASFSSTGPAVELAAPGVSIRSTVPGGGYDVYSGTSMASPHVAGVAALVLAAASGAYNTTVRECLTNTAEDLGAQGWDSYFGYGLVRADLAVAALSGGGGTTNNPPVANDDSATTYENTAVNIDVLVNDYDPDNDVLSVSAVTQGKYGSVAINTDYTVTYTPNANFNDIDSFTYTASDGNGGTATATVTVTVSDGSQTGQMYTDLEGWRELKGKSGLWEAFVTVWVSDYDNYAVPDATVSGTWSGDASGSVSGVTGSNGGITFATGSMKSGTSVTFTVNDVDKTGYTYDSEFSTTQVTIYK